MLYPLRGQNQSCPTAMVLLLSPPFTWTTYHPRPLLLPVCALSKQGHRLLSSLDAASGDPTVTHRLIRKFVAASPKSVTLNALSHLISDPHRHSSVVLPMYEQIAETPWFNWNPKLVANLIASLDNQGRFDEAEILISDSVQKLGFRDLVLLYCNLIDSYSKYGSKSGVFDTFARLQEQLTASSSTSLSRKAFVSMINGLCALNLPHDAEKKMEEMINNGFDPSSFEYRSILLAHGRSGSFGDMTRVLEQMERSGYTLDTICSNVVLSSYGAHGELSEMVSWIRRMKNSNIPFSIRTHNTVLNSCPTIMKLLEDPKTMPLWVEELMEKLEGSDETLLVEELMNSSVLVENLEWGTKEGKLDLHGMHSGTVYVMMLQWVEELRSRFCDEKLGVPEEIIVVCGLGKHSTVRGESPVKALVLEMMTGWESPMRLERKGGFFVAKGRNVRSWLGYV